MFSLNILSDTTLKPIISPSFKTNRCFKVVISFCFVKHVHCGNFRRQSKNKIYCLLITTLRGTTHFVLYSTVILLCISFGSLFFCFVLFSPLTDMQPCWHEAISLPHSSNCSDYKSVPPCPVSQFLFLKVCHHFAYHHTYLQ